jgi:cyclopropane fatty-acyl-phospholipid synthase-like methyltransferase
MSEETTAARSSDPVGRHDWFSPSYVDQWIDDDDEGRARRPTLRAIATRLSLPAGTGHRILDVGGGWGELTRATLDVHPAAHVTLQDFSQPMLDRAARRLADRAHRITFVKADLRDPGWTQSLGGPFAGVVSSLAIHNVRDNGVIARIYRDLHGVLVPGGSLVDYDLVDGHTAEERQAWLTQAGFAPTEVATDSTDPHLAFFTATRPPAA